MPCNALPSMASMTTSSSKATSPRSFVCVCVCVCVRARVQRASRARMRAHSSSISLGSRATQNLVMLTAQQVRAGYYQMYYSPRVYTERPELVTITLAIEVSGYDMGALKDFASARPCVRVQLPEVRPR